MTSVIDKINGGANAPAPTSGKNGTQLGQQDFLRLMTTQLTTQDPFNPVENTEMIAQMAQFSSVAGIAEMNQNLQTIAATLNPNRLTDAASWIGRSMLVDSDVATPIGDGNYAGQVTLPKSADQVTLNFVDENGTVVHTENLGAQAQGDLAFAWNGKDAAGNVVANGPLQVVVNAKSGGETLETSTATWTGIAGIQSPSSGGATQLVTGLGLLSPSEAIRLA